MRVLLVILLATLARAGSAQSPERFIPRDSDALVRLASADRFTAIVAPDGPFRELMALLPPDQMAELDRARNLLDGFSRIFESELLIGLRYGVLGKVRIQAATATKLSLAEIEAQLAEVTSLEQQPTRKRSGDHDLLVYGDAIAACVHEGYLLIASGLDDLEAMIELEPTKSADRAPDLARLAEEARDSDLWGVLRMKRLLKEEKAEDMRADNFVGTLVLEGLRRDLAAAERLYFHANLEPDLRLRVRTRGPEQTRDWTTANREAALLPALAGEIARVRIDRDVAAFWADREALVTDSALPGLAKFSQNLDTLLAGFTTAEFAASLEPGLDLIAVAKAATPSSPQPLLPRLVLAFELREDRAPEVDDRLRVAFQTAIGAVNLGAGREHRRPFLQYSKTIAGVEVLAARLVGPRATDVAGVEENFEPALSIVGNRLFIASDIEGAKSAVSSALSRSRVVVGGDRLSLDGAGLARLLLDNRRPIEDGRMLDEGESPEEASLFVDRLADLAGSIEDLVFRRLSTTRGAVWDLLVRRPERAR